MTKDKIMDPEELTEEIRSNGGTFTCRVPTSLYSLEGHFDGFPLVPGVCQIQWIVKRIERIKKCPVGVKEISSMKFLQFLRPGDEFSIEIEEKNHAWRYLIVDGDKKYASGKIITTQ